MSLDLEEYEKQKKKAIEETRRICQERGILVPFLTDHREEVIEIMSRTFDAEVIAELDAPDDIHRESSSEVDDIILSLDKICSISCQPRQIEVKSGKEMGVQENEKRNQSRNGCIGNKTTRQCREYS